ncbi:MAG: S8 family serine peptidase [Bryobacteraceae bacterium]|nr:S8 family serine peptidase [Bryobacteraceae bacterium]
MRRYALLLDTPPVIEQVTPADAKSPGNAAVTTAEQRVASSQHRVRAAIDTSRVAITGDSSFLVNALYVRATPEDAKALESLPGVQKVVWMRPYKRMDEPALRLVKGPEAWAFLGGESNAGAGVRIGIIDSGVDHNHPSMQDSSLPPPAGGRRCSGSDCDYTNNKVIAARSYVVTLDRPDDLTPRDRVGHGTAVAALAAGRRVQGQAGTVIGVAPKAYIGNYKVFGSPGVNDSTYGDVLTAALQDAFNDGMDVVTLSLGLPAEWTPLDQVCGPNRNRPCDPFAYAVFNAVQAGMSVVVAAGNEGEDGLIIPSRATISSPGTVQNAITVGATTNSRALYHGLRVEGSDVPAQLQRIRALLANGPRPIGNYKAPLRDVAAIGGDDGRACQPLGRDTLSGAIAIIRQGGCRFLTKVENAQRAGASAVVFYRSEGETPFPILGVQDTIIPSLLIGATDGQALRDFLSSRPNREATIDTSLQPVNREADIVTAFSSLGPSLVNAQIKPEVVAPGINLYAATQKYDPNGDMYDESAYTVTQGTSFAVASVAGAVALVKQRNPSWTAPQLKSAVVNTANPEVLDTDDPNRPASVFAAGAGKLDAREAVRTIVTADPAAISFGAWSTSAPRSVGVVFYNGGPNPVSVRLRVRPRNASSANVVVSQETFTIQPNSRTGAVSVSVGGTRPAAGIYEGFIEVEGAGAPFAIPYAFVVPDGVPDNAIPLRSYDFESYPGEEFGPLSFKVIDRFGLPVQGVQVNWTARTSGAIIQTSGRTDEYGIAEAYVRIGEQLGEQVFRAELVGAGLEPLDYIAVVRLLPVIDGQRVVDAASGRPRVAPGSYLSIFGRGLATGLGEVRTPYLPLSIGGTSVSFFIRDRVWAPGTLHFVSDGQVNVQVPWELLGQSSATMWVTVAGIASANYTLTLQDVFPGFFEYFDQPGNRQLLVAARGADVITMANPARRGEELVFYANGLGDVSNRPRTGEVALVDPLSRVQASVEITVGGRPASVEFAGLTPGVVALYQLNVKIPADAPTGIQPVVMRVAGVEAKTANIPIQ